MKDKNKAVGSKITKDTESKKEKRETVMEAEGEKYSALGKVWGATSLQLYSTRYDNKHIKNHFAYDIYKKIDNNKNVEMKKCIILIMNQCKSISYRQDHEVWDHEA